MKKGALGSFGVSVASVGEASNLYGRIWRLQYLFTNCRWNQSCAMQAVHLFVFCSPKMAAPMFPKAALVWV